MAETRCFFSRLINGLATYMQWLISVRGRTDQWRQHNAFSWYDQWRQHDATSLGWSMVRGNTGHLLGVTDKILMHAEIKHYTHIGIHTEYTLASTEIGTIRYYKTQYNRNKLTVSSHTICFFDSNKGQFDTIFCYT